MSQTPINAYSLKWSIFLHLLFLLIAGSAALFPGCRPREVQIPLDFTVVLDENLEEPNVPPEADEQETPKRKDAPVTPPNPEPPQPLPPPPDVVAVEQQKKPQKKEKPKPEPKPNKPVKKPPSKPEPKPFKMGPRVTRPIPAKPTVDFTKLKPVTLSPVPQKRLSAGEIARALQEGARPGIRNHIPENEIARCILLVKNALYEAWEQPAKDDAGARPAQLELRLNTSGKIISYRICQSSGNPHFDQTVLKAAAKTPPIRGLTLAFLKQYEAFTVEFKLQ